MCKHHICSLYTFNFLYKICAYEIVIYYTAEIFIYTNCKQYLNFSELLQLLKFVSLLIYFMGNFRCYKNPLCGIHVCMYVSKLYERITQEYPHTLTT